MGATYPVSAASIAAGRLKVSQGGNGGRELPPFGNWNGSETERFRSGKITDRKQERDGDGKVKTLINVAFVLFVLFGSVGSVPAQSQPEGPFNEWVYRETVDEFTREVTPRATVRHLLPDGGRFQLMILELECEPPPDAATRRLLPDLPPDARPGLRCC